MLFLEGYSKSESLKVNVAPSCAFLKTKLSSAYMGGGQFFWKLRK